jgi:hypothetical protein
MQKKLLGHVGVDSGQLIVTDPCYIKMFTNNEFNPRTKYMNVRDNKKIIVHPDDFYNYEDDMIEGYNKNMNTLIREGIFKEIEDDEERNDRSYSYNGASCATCYESDQGGGLGLDLGVVFSSGFGDGHYPVYAYYEKVDGWGTRIKKVEIEFFTDEDLIDDEEDDDAI